MPLNYCDEDTIAFSCGFPRGRLMVQRLQPLEVAQHLGVTPELLVSLCVCRCESEGEVTKIGIWGVLF